MGESEPESEETPVPYRPVDVTGRRIRVGQIVRVVGVPDLSAMNQEPRAECEPVFQYLMDKYKKVEEIHENGFIELFFRIRNGPHKGLHFVFMEPHLLRVRRRRRRRGL